MRLSARQLPLSALALLLLAVIIFPQPSRADQDIRDSLNSAYANKAFIVHGFYTGSKLRFNSSGAPIGKLSSGYWSSDGLLQISTIKMDKNRQILITGKRAVSAFDANACTFSTVLTTTPVEIRIEPDPVQQDFTSINDLLHKVLTEAATAEMKAILPEYWHPWLGPIQRVTGKDGKIECRTAAQTPESRSPEPDSQNGTDANLPAEGRLLYVRSDGVEVFKMGQDIKPPKVAKAPDPDYTFMAKLAHFQGTTVFQTVIDQQGIPTEISVVRPLGIGLDDAALKSVQKWRFRPATRNGVPVAVQINIEVNYRLY